METTQIFFDSIEMCFESTLIDSESILMYFDRV